MNPISLHSPGLVSARHLGAFVSATRAGGRACPHHVIGIAVVSAAGRAGAADIGACATDIRAVIRAADHEVGTNAANLRAIQHELDVARLGVAPALGQAMRHGCEAGAMAVQAGLDTSVHGVVVMMHGLGSLGVDPQSVNTAI